MKTNVARVAAKEKRSARGEENREERRTRPAVVKAAGEKDETRSTEEKAKRGEKTEGRGGRGDGRKTGGRSGKRNGGEAAMNDRNQRNTAPRKLPGIHPEYIIHTGVPAGGVLLWVKRSPAPERTRPEGREACLRSRRAAAVLRLRSLGSRATPKTTLNYSFAQMTI